MESQQMIRGGVTGGNGDASSLNNNNGKEEDLAAEKTGATTVVAGACSYVWDRPFFYATASSDVNERCTSVSPLPPSFAASGCGGKVDDHEPAQAAASGLFLVEPRSSCSGVGGVTTTTATSRPPPQQQERRRRVNHHQEEEDSKPPAEKKQRRCSLNNKTNNKKKKKRRLSAMAQSSSSVVSLSLDALSLVMEFLSPRQLFNLAFTCKTLMASVNTKMVVQSALIHGGPTKTTFDQLYHLLAAKSIHVPSPLRLLRLANGKRCEFCHNKKIRKGLLGVFACWECTTQGGGGGTEKATAAEPDGGEKPQQSCDHDDTRDGPLTRPWKKPNAVKYRKNKQQYDAIFSHPRVTMLQHRVWSSPCQTVSDERIGPLVAYTDIDGIFKYLVDGEGRTIDTYLQEKIQQQLPSVGPSRRVAAAAGCGFDDDENDDPYQEFNTAYTQTLDRAQKVANERIQKRMVAQEQAKQEREAKIKHMLFVELPQLLDEPYRQFALKQQESPYGFADCLHVFRIPFVDKLLQPYLRTSRPSKIRKKTCNDIAQTINKKLSLITNKVLGLDAYLSDNSPLEAALKYRFRYTNAERLLLEEDKANSDEFFSLLEKDQIIAALAHLLHNDLSSFLLMVKVGATTTAAAAAATTTEISSNDMERSASQLARMVWFEKLSEEQEKYQASGNQNQPPPPPPSANHPSDHCINTGDVTNQNNEEMENNNQSNCNDDEDRSTVAARMLPSIQKDPPTSSLAKLPTDNSTNPGVANHKSEEKENDNQNKTMDNMDQLLLRAFTTSQAAMSAVQRGLQGFGVWLDRKYPDDVEVRNCILDAAACTTAGAQGSLILHLLLAENYKELDQTLGDVKAIRRQKERFLMFTRVLMKYFETKDPALHQQVKAIIKDCAERNKRHERGYESVTASMRERLKHVVGDANWKRAESYLAHFLAQKAKQRQQAAEAKRQRQATLADWQRQQQRTLEAARQQ